MREQSGDVFGAGSKTNPPGAANRLGAFRVNELRCLPSKTEAGGPRLKLIENFVRRYLMAVDDLGLDLLRGGQPR